MKTSEKNFLERKTIEHDIIEGDFNLVSKEEVLKLAGGDASGRVQR